MVFRGFGVDYFYFLCRFVGVFSGDSGDGSEVSRDGSFGNGSAARRRLGDGVSGSEG